MKPSFARGNTATAPVLGVRTRVLHREMVSAVSVAYGKPTPRFETKPLELEVLCTCVMAGILLRLLQVSLFY